MHVKDAAQFKDDNVYNIINTLLKYTIIFQVWI